MDYHRHRTVHIVALVACAATLAFDIVGMVGPLYNGVFYLTEYGTVEGNISHTSYAAWELCSKAVVNGTYVKKCYSPTSNELPGIKHLQTRLMAVQAMGILAAIFGGLTCVAISWVVRQEQNLRAYTAVVVLAGFAALWGFAGSFVVMNLQHLDHDSVLSDGIVIHSSSTFQYGFYCAVAGAVVILVVAVTYGIVASRVRRVVVGNVQDPGAFPGPKVAYGAVGDMSSP